MNLRCLLLGTTTAFAAVIAAPLAAGAQDAGDTFSPTTTVLLETIVVLDSLGNRSVNPPTFESQRERFLRRPGAETVVSVTEQDPGKQTNLSDIFEMTPGVFVTDGGGGTGGFISMRGSDIATDGPRNGRGIRMYLDGIPLGRTDAGFTSALIDLGAADYVEVYRGGNSLRYGAIATGGALNFVSKTGRTAPGTRVTVSGGSFQHLQGQVEHGAATDKHDLYLQFAGLYDGGFRDHTTEKNFRFSGNVGVRLTENIESRTFFAVGRTRQDLAGTVPLDRLAELRRTAPTLSFPPVGTYPHLFNEDLNFDYQRLANRTTIRDGDTTYELGAYFLNTEMDHLPSPFAGIIDYKWKEMGVSARVEHKTEFAGKPTELVGGARLGYALGDFDRYRHLNNGADKGMKVFDWDFSSWLLETYGEAAIEVLPHVKAFLGLQGVFTTRTLEDNWSGGAVPTLGPVVPPPPPPPTLRPGGPQPGRPAGLQEYERNFAALNPKFGLNWEYAPAHFLFANVARSYEVPTGADLSNVLSYEARTGNDLPDLKAQSAWTWEIGVRGGQRRLQYDLTLYHMRLRNEILSRCADPACSETIAFNAGRTVHNGIEFGLQTMPFVDVFAQGDNIFLNGVWNISDFKFDGDPIFGNNKMPVIPTHQVYGELGYRHPSGLYMLASLKYLSERKTTFDGSGGPAFIVPSYVLLGAKVGYRSPDDRWSAYIEGRNLTDEVYVSEFSADVTASGTSPAVRPGNGRAVYAGVSFKF